MEMRNPPAIFVLYLNEVDSPNGGLTNGKTKNHLQQIQEIEKVGFPVSNDHHRVPGFWEKKQRLQLSRSESLLGTVRDGHPKSSGIEPAQPAFMNAET